MKKTNKDFVADKCIYDYYVYASALEMHNAIVDTTKLVVSYMTEIRQYDYVFYIAPEFPLVTEGLRSLNDQFQKDVDTKYFQFLKDHDISYYQLSGSVEDRFQAVKRIITT